MNAPTNYNVLKEINIDELETLLFLHHFYPVNDWENQGIKYEIFYIDISNVLVITEDNKEAKFYFVTLN